METNTMNTLIVAKITLTKPLDPPLIIGSTLIEGKTDEIEVADVDRLFNTVLSVELDEGLFNRLYGDEGLFNRLCDEEGPFNMVYDEEGLFNMVYDEEGLFNRLYDDEGLFNRLYDEEGLFNVV